MRNEDPQSSILKTVVWLQKNLIYDIFIVNVAKKQHTHFEDNILRKFAGEDKLQVVPACMQ